MARQMRIEYAGALYHIMSRGNGRGVIYLNDEDRKLFLATLQNVIERYGWKCYAYCLMNNHYHLLVETPGANLSIGMRQLNGVYTQSFNRAHKSTGHVFQGRFKAHVVEKQNYLLILSAYIALNPVRGKLVKKSEDWAWSSYRMTLGIDSVPNWLDARYIRDQFGSSEKTARKNYERFVADQSNKSTPWNDVTGQVLLGEHDFIVEMCEKIADKQGEAEIPHEQRFFNRPELKDIFSKITTTQERNKKIIELYFKYGYRQSEIARYAGLHYGTVSRFISARKTE